LVLDEILEEDNNVENDAQDQKNVITNEDNAMLIYTSGTTGSPKGKQSC
jgi:long-subunit acyl-CoA synthetase (AMP-forming)